MGSKQKRNKYQNEAIREERKRIREMRKAAREEMRLKIDAAETWEELIPLIAEEEEPDIAAYKEQLERANITFHAIKTKAIKPGVRARRMQSGSIELSYREGDHTIAWIIPVEGEVYFITKDYLKY